MAERRPEVSVVIPVYNGEGTVARTVADVRAAFAGRATLEVVLVDDGSADGSAAACARLAEDGSGRTLFLRLARNFGEHNAVMAGLRHSSGEFAVVIDDDLQHDPADAVRLFTAARDGGKDLVYGALTTREHSWWRTAASRLNGWMATVLLGKPPGLYLSSFKCMSRWLVDEVCRYQGPYPYIDGLALRCTANLISIPVSHRPRAEGRSGYTLRKLLRLWLNVFVNFSVLPLRLSAGLGFAMVGLGAVLAVEAVAERLFGPAVPSGWSSLVVIIIVFSGVQLLILGLLGEYLGRLYMASSESPQYAVRERRGPPA